MSVSYTHLGRIESLIGYDVKKMPLPVGASGPAYDPDRKSVV